MKPQNQQLHVVSIDPQGKLVPGPRKRAGNQSKPGRPEGRACRIAALALMVVLASAMGELLLEAATQSRSADVHVVALLGTCSEFAGCCLVAFLSGGRWLVTPELEGLSEIGAKDVSSGCTPLKRKVAMFVRGYSPFAVTAALSCIGSIFGNLALGYVQYPVKVIFKSSKLLPSMVVSVVFGNHRRFNAEEYCAAIVVCLGTAAFTSIGAGRSSSESSGSAVATGAVLLIVASFSDAIVVNAQEWLFRSRQVLPETLILRQNFLGLLASIITLWSTSDDPHGLFTQLLTDHNSLQLAVALGFSTGLAVWSCTHLVNEAGSVVKEEVSLLRKVITLLLSYLVWPKPFFWKQQGMGLVCVVIGLLLQHQSKVRASRAKRRGH